MKTGCASCGPPILLLTLFLLFPFTLFAELQEDDGDSFEQCEDLFFKNVGPWLRENGWERLHGTREELELAPVGPILHMHEWSLGGTSSVVWKHRAAGVVLK